MVANLIKRDTYPELLRDIERDEIAFLTGPRQSGKTTLMKLVQAELTRQGQKTLFLSLDFEPDRQFFVSQQRLLQKIELEIGKGKGFVFIDEIQRKQDAGVFLKGIHDLGLPWKLIVSGSGSVDLKAKIKESMVGRKRVYDVYPISLTEFANFRRQYKYEEKLRDLVRLQPSTLDGILSEYLSFGGYPRVILETEQADKLRTMDEIYQGYVEKDIGFLLKVEKIEAFGLLLKLLAGQVGRLVNYAELSSTAGVSLATVKNYLWYAEKTYTLQRVSPFFRNTRSEISKAPVVYFSDLGLRNYALGIFGRLSRPEDSGFAFQNLVFQILRQRLRWTAAGIHHWRSKAGAEVDFVIAAGSKLIPLEVKYSRLPRPSVTRSLASFVDKYKPEVCFVVNRSLREEIRIQDARVVFLTVWDLLSEPLV